MKASVIQTCAKPFLSQSYTFAAAVMLLNVRLHAYCLQARCICRSSVTQTETPLCISCISHYNKGHYRFTWDWKDEGVKVRSHHEQASLQPALGKDRGKMTLWPPNYLEPPLNWMTGEHAHEYKYSSHSTHSEKSTHILDKITGGKSIFSKNIWRQKHKSPLTRWISRPAVFKQVVTFIICTLDLSLKAFCSVFDVCIVKSNDVYGGHLTLGEKQLVIH